MSLEKIFLSQGRFFLTKSNLDRGLINLSICLQVAYLCATCLLVISYGKEGLYILICQIEPNFERPPAFELL